MSATESPSAVYPAPALYIAGEWIDASGAERTVPVHNPATGEVLADLPVAETHHVDAALQAAERGFRAWRKVSASERGGILRRAADLMRERTEEIAQLITLEEGKPLSEARLEVTRTADTFEWSGEEIRHAYGRVLPYRADGHLHYVVSEPIGPVAAFAPWNFPALAPGRKVAEFLAAGCSGVVKPAEEAPATFLAILRCCLDAGVHPEAVSVVFGDPGRVAEELISSPVIRHVTFTGSVPVGRQLSRLSGQYLKRQTMELGGHAPVIVFDDADIEQFMAVAPAAKFRNAGQICASPSRFFVQKGIYDDFVAEFSKRALALQVGNGLVEGTEMGPLASDRRVTALQHLIDDASGFGGTEILSGSVPEGSGGSYLAPTLIVNAPDEAEIMREEPFGPVVPIAPFESFDEVIGRANGVPYGLASYAFSTSSSTCLAVSQQLEAGVVAINSFEVVTNESPFGGVKDSGFGSEGGTEGVASFLVTKYVNSR
jgi:succinate-semialdehyde dehydrogenase/glutarate-semialdehyde dehydrogenase